MGTTSGRGARRRLGRGSACWLIALLCGAGSGLAASPATAAPTAPQTALQQAQAQLQGLTGGADPAAQAALDDAVSQLAAATSAYLWPGPSDALPPPTGDLVFSDAASALADLTRIRHDPSLPAGAVTSASDEIIGACDALAQAALQRAGLSDPHAPHGPPGPDPHAARAQYDRGFRALGHQISAALARVPQATIDQAAENFLNSGARFAFGPVKLSGAPLTLHGKPELFAYLGEFCPFCAATRWSLALALDQFGHFPPLALSESSPVDLDPSTNTLSFHHANYDSPLLSLGAVEAWSNQQCTFSASCPYGFTSLEPLTSADLQILTPNDPNGFLPYLDFGNAWQDLWLVNPALLQGMSWEQIAAAMADPGSAIGQSLDGAAELFAGMLCEETGGRPATVCASPVISSYQQLLSAPPVAVDAPNALQGISCFKSQLCAAVDTAGNVLISQDPTAATPSWRSSNIDGATPVLGVACPSASQCFAVDSAGNALVTENAGAATPTWSAPSNIDASNVLYYVRCPSTSLCLATDGAGNVVQTDDADAATPTWSAPANIDGANALELACPSTSLCVASDAAGNVLVSDDPNAANPTWSPPDKIDANGFGDIACPTTSFCIAVDYAGNDFVTHNASDATPTWSGPTTIDGQNLLDGVSCASASLCLAVDASGNAALSDDADAATPTWTTETNVSAFGLDDATCPSSSLCLATDGGGDIFTTDNPTALNPTWGPPGRFLAPTP